LFILIQWDRRDVIGEDVIFVCWRGIYLMDGNLITVVLVSHLIKCLQFKCTGAPQIFHLNEVGK
jgi:hypothetical protein